MKRFFACLIILFALSAAVVRTQNYSFGNITATTPNPGDNSTNVATTAFIAANAGLSNVPRPNTKRWAYMATDGSTAVASTPSIGDKFATFSTAGASNVVLATSTNPSIITVTSGAGNGDEALTFGNLGFSMGRNLRAQIYGSVSAYTNNSIQAYLGDVNAKLVPTVGGNYIGFKAVSGTDTNIQCVTRDGTTVTDVDSGIVANTSFHKYDILVNDSVPNATFYIDGSQVCQISTHLPAAGTMMRWAYGAFVITGAASFTVNWAWSYVESDF